MKFQLNADERDALVDMSTAYGWPVLLKLMDQLVERQEQAVLKFNVEDGSEKLLHAKCRAEGARKFRSDIEEFTKLLKKKDR